MDENRNNETIVIFLNETSIVNATEDGTFDSPKFVFSDWILYLYFAVIFCGSVTNFVYILALIRCRRSGILSLVMQLCAADVLLPCAAVIELFTLNQQTWIFSQETCLFYNGFEILINSLTIWFIICLNFQIISLWNLQKNESKKKGRNPLTACEDESNECLVTKKDNTTRILNIDYSRRKKDVSVIIPTILIWFFCISLSIPNFTLSSILKIHSDQRICAIIDNFYGYVLQMLLLVFKAVLPLPLLLLSLVILIIKLFKTSSKNIDNILTKEFAEIKSLLLYCIASSVLYIFISIHRNIFHILHMYYHRFSDDSASIFKVPPLYNNQLNSLNSVCLSMLHYSSNIVRAVLAFYLLPKFRKLIRDKVFICYKSNH